MAGKFFHLTWNVAQFNGSDPGVNDQNDFFCMLFFVGC